MTAGAFSFRQDPRPATAALKACVAPQDGHGTPTTILIGHRYDVATRDKRGLRPTTQAARNGAAPELISARASFVPGETAGRDPSGLLGLIAIARRRSV
jgi:hypothetical protein